MEHPPEATVPSAAPQPPAATPPAATPAAPELELHESAAIFPPLRDAEFEALVADIREHGQHEPIWTWQGKVIDGRHRLRACKKLGIAPLTREWDGNGSLLEFVISANLRRRHLKENQRAMIAARMLPHFEAEAKKRKQQACHIDLSANLHTGRSTDIVGKILSVSWRSVNHARKLLDHGIPELIARVDAGTLAVSLAAKIAGYPAEEQAGLMELNRTDIVATLRMWQGLPLEPEPKPKPDAAQLAAGPKTAEQLEDEEKIDALIRNTQIGPGAQLSNTPQGLRLELTHADCLTEFYRLNSDRFHLLDLLDRGVFIVRRKHEAS